MTQLMGRPILELPGELGARPVRSDLLAGVRAALLGLALVVVPVFGLWVATPNTDADASAVARLAGAVWLLGHGAPLLGPDTAAPVTVTPLLLGLFVAGRLYRAGARSVTGAAAARQGARAWWRGPAAVCAGYCSVAAIVVAQCAGEGAGSGPFRSWILPDLLVVALLAAVATAAGARSARPAPAPDPGAARDDGPGPDSDDDLGAEPGTGAWRQVPAWVPDRLRPAGAGPAVRTAALAGLFGLLAAGALVVAVAAVLDVADAFGGTDPAASALGGGPAALAGLVLLSVLLLPNAVLCGAAYALGPGFAVGTGTTVGPSATVLGPLPEFPLFALLPAPGAGGWHLAVCVLPVLAAVVPGLLLGRAASGRGTDRAPWHPAATAVAVLTAALLVGAAATAAGWLAGGALAAGRMARLGPPPWTAGLAAATWIAAVATPVALLSRATALGAAGAPSSRVGLLTHRARVLAHAAVRRLGRLLGSPH
ncbi:cell division protein PerM [Kitasatospora sp. NPDC004240]